MIQNKDVALKTAESLLQIKAIKLQPENPFTWASGWKSPIYCDNRLTLSFPNIRSELKIEFAKQIQELYGKPDYIAGVATGAIAIGVLVAEYLNVPFIYVRDKAKGHGRQNQIEGFLKPGSNVVVIEDLISTGGSSLKAVDVLQEVGAHVLGMMAIFTYDFPVAQENFDKANVRLNTLSDYNHLLEQASQQGTISNESVEMLKEWRKDPSVWGL
ncbi:MAG: orotate phosphoribosyltransferase [Schleiferiaceae bacterium]|jgi:orotate phosphoribosyltransferase|nr:orotate phosphoribosyltransferase [Schleiferiaceae bacterium]|tara:strand:+ start:1646 stop:2287 length:642 start_codon:yes stop_codon:yes gene_type:complete